jgi:Cellulase (glycosyl hydrolase family 5)
MIIGPDGQQFVPEGVVLFCLAQRDLTCEQPSEQNPNTDTTKIQASATYWHANTVRLQVAQESLFNQSPVNSSYLASIDNEVHLAGTLGMVAIISLQEEQFNGPPMPTASSQRFWTFMAKHFAGTPGVMFDLFNEPRLKAYQGQSWLWNIWQNGGSVNTNGVNDTFVGMQSLVNAVRETGAHNVIIAEGMSADHDLSGLPSHLLTGGSIAYGIDPDLETGRTTPTQWDAAFGTIADQEPLVMDEFHDFPTSKPCNPSSPTLLPELFSYLQSKHLGLLAWTFQPGNLIVGNNLDQPTSYSGYSTQLCVAHTKKHKAIGNVNALTTGTDGPGADILGFFAATSHTLPPSEMLGKA